MELSDYLKKNQITIEKFANLIGYERTYLVKVINKRILPGKFLAMAIQRQTKGEVTMHELMSSQIITVAEEKEWLKEFREKRSRKR